MGIFKKIDAGLDNTNLRGIVSDMPAHGYLEHVSIVPSDYTNNGRVMARAHVVGPFHVDLASIGENYFCFIALGENGNWGDVQERNVFDLKLSTAWSRNSTVTKAYIKTIAEVRSMAEAYYKLEAEGFSFDDLPNDSALFEDADEDDDGDDEDFDWAGFAEGQEEVSASASDEAQPDEEEELIPLDEAIRIIESGMEDVMDDIFSLANFKKLIKATQDVLKEHEVDIFLKVGNKGLEAEFPDRTAKATTKGLEDAFFLADKAHWAYYDPSRKGKPYKTTQIALLEGPEMFALYVSYFFLMRGISTLTTEEGRAAAEKNNLNLGLFSPILSFLKEIKEEQNDTTSVAASAYLDGWQEIVDKYS